MGSSMKDKELIEKKYKRVSLMPHPLYGEGSYSEAYFYDKDGNYIEEEKAEMIQLCIYDKNGKLMETERLLITNEAEKELN